MFNRWTERHQAIVQSLALSINSQLNFRINSDRRLHWNPNNNSRRVFLLFSCLLFFMRDRRQAVYCVLIVRTQRKLIHSNHVLPIRLCHKILSMLITQINVVQYLMRFKKENGRRKFKGNVKRTSTGKFNFNGNKCVMWKEHLQKQCSTSVLIIKQDFTQNIGESRII